MAARQSDDAAGGMAAVASQTYGYHISTPRIVVLSIISMGLYWVYWMYRTWRQYRDHTIELAAENGETHHPVWHGLTQIVPVYGWFRYHAHVRSYKTLMQERGIANSLNPGLLTSIIVVNSIVAMVAVAAVMRNPDPADAWSDNGGVIRIVINSIVAMVAGVIRIPDPADAWSGNDGVILDGIIISIITLIVAIMVLCRMQSNLDAYWASVDHRLMRAARFGIGEALLIVIGILMWATAVLPLLIPILWNFLYRIS